MFASNNVRQSEARRLFLTTCSVFFRQLGQKQNLLDPKTKLS